MYEFTHLPVPARVGMIGSRISSLEAEVLTRQIELVEVGAMTLDAAEADRLSERHTRELESLYRRITAVRGMLAEHAPGEAGGDTPPGGSAHDHHH